MSVIKNISLICCLVIIFTSCEEKVEPPIGACEDNLWASATKNGEDYCLGTVNVIYWFANTEQAKIDLTAGTTDKVSISEIEASFKVPVAGISTNIVYPLTEGKIAGADEFTEGTIRFINYSEGCIAGTFELKAENSVAGIIQTYTNGKFLINSSGDQDSNCNPFN